MALRLVDVPERDDNTAGLIPPLELTTLKGTITSTRPSVVGHFMSLFLRQKMQTRRAWFPRSLTDCRATLRPTDKAAKALKSVFHWAEEIIGGTDAGTGAQKDDHISASGSGGLDRPRKTP